jgi:hypothetical protein
MAAGKSNPVLKNTAALPCGGEQEQFKIIRTMAA